MCNKDNICCCFLSFISTLLASIGISAIFYEGLITSIIVLVYFALILGIISLIFVLFYLFCGRTKCKCINNNCLVSTSVISIILSIFALTATSLATFSIPVAIFIGALTFIFLNNIISLIKVISCLVCDKGCKYPDKAC